MSGSEWSLSQASPAWNCTSQSRKEPSGILAVSGTVSSLAWGAQIVEAVAVPERCRVLPPHAGLPDHPVWMFNHSRKWVQGYPHAKLSQIVSFPEVFINKITVALPVCPRPNTSKLQMQDQSEKIWGMTLALQYYCKKKKNLKVAF